MSAAPRDSILPRFEGRVLPHSLVAEQSILGGVLLQPAAIGQIENLEVDDFYDLRHKIVFGAMRVLQARGAPIDVVTVEIEIDRAGKLDAIGGIAFLGELALRVPTVDNMLEYARQVRRLAANRAGILALATAIERAYDWPHEPAELLSETVGELQRLDARAAEGTPAADAKVRWCISLESFLGDEEPSDDDAEDWIIRDILPRGEAGIIAGPPKCGKTWAMLGLGIDVALGKPWLDAFDNTFGEPMRVLALAFEDGQRRLRKRVWELCRARGITPNDARLRAHLSISREPLSLPGDERALAAELKRVKPGLVLIDNLTRVMVGDQNAIKDAKRFSDTWCKLCSDVGAAVVFLHHTSKVGPIRPDKRGEGDPFELIRGSGDLVASARHLVLMRPLESPDAEKLSDVRMRGNLDLRVEDFVLGFERKHEAERWVARLANRGAGEAVRDELAERRRAKAEERKAARAGGRGGDGGSDDDRVFAAIVRLHSQGKRMLCTIAELQSSSGVSAKRVRPAVTRLEHAGRIVAEAVDRTEGGAVRKRTIWTPAGTGGSVS